MGYVFISFSSKKRAEAEQVRDLFRESGIRVWMAPEDIAPGSSYPGAINRAIMECACFVLILSRSAQESPWVLNEVERAIHYKRPMFVIRTEDFNLNDDFQMCITRVQQVFAPEIDMESEEIQRVIEIIRSIPGMQEAQTDESAEREQDAGQDLPLPAAGQDIAAEQVSLEEEPAIHTDQSPKKRKRIHSPDRI